MEQEKQEHKSFQDLIGKYLVINGQEPGFKIEKIEPTPFEAYTSIIFCEHNLTLYMTDAHIQILHDNNIIIIGGNNYSINVMEVDDLDVEKWFESNKKEVLKNVERKIKEKSTKHLDVWKQRWWDMYCFAQKELKMVPIEAADYANHSVTKGKEEMDNFFKDK